MTAQTDKCGQTRAGIVLCGGRSSRMGRAKADLPFGDETMLMRVVRRLSQVVNPIAIVAAGNQRLPGHWPNGAHILVVRDSLEFAGPLAGIGMGLSAIRALKAGPMAAFVTSCDVPFLQPRFVEELFLQLETYEVAVPIDESFLHPLAAVYRVPLATTVQRLVSQGLRRPRDLFKQVRTRHVPSDTLRRVDPDLVTLRNINTPHEYLQALQTEALPIPNWLLEQTDNEEG